MDARLDDFKPHGIDKETLITVAARYRQIEGGNNECERLLLLCQNFGSAEDISLAQSLIEFRNTHGGFSESDSQFKQKWELHDKIYPLYTDAIQHYEIDIEEEISKPDFGEVEGENLIEAGKHGNVTCKWFKENMRTLPEMKDEKSAETDNRLFARVFLRGWTPKIADDIEAEHISDAGLEIFLAEMKIFFQTTYNERNIIQEFKEGADSIPGERPTFGNPAAQFTKLVKLLILSEDITAEEGVNKFHYFTSYRFFIDRYRDYEHDPRNPDEYKKAYLTFYKIINKALAARTGNEKIEGPHEHNREFYPFLDTLHLRLGLNNYSQRGILCDQPFRTNFRHGHASDVLDQIAEDRSFDDGSTDAVKRAEKLLALDKKLADIKETYGNHYDPLILIPAYEFPETKIDVRRDDFQTQLDLIEDQLDYLATFAAQRKERETVPGLRTEISEDVSEIV